jgi:hypothetical protein
VSDEDVAVVRDAAAKTALAETAAIGFAWNLAVLDTPLSRLLNRRSSGAFHGALSEYGMNWSLLSDDLPGGVIDFTRGRSRLRQGSGWRVDTPWVNFFGGSGEWEAEWSETEVIGCATPMWIFALSHGVTDASSIGTTTSDHQERAAFKTHASIKIAAQNSGWPLGPVLLPSADDNDPDRIPLLVAVNNDGLLVSLVVPLRRGATVLELGEFGQPEPVTLPRPAEVVESYGPAPNDWT